MTLTSKNLWSSPVRNMSHSGLTGWTIPTPHSLQHLNGGKSEIQGPASGAEILASQKARVTRICPIRAPIPHPGRNHMSQTRKTMSLTPKNFRLSPVQNRSHSGLTGWAIPTPHGFQHLNGGRVKFGIRWALYNYRKVQRCVRTVVAVHKSNKMIRDRYDEQIF